MTQRWVLASGLLGLGLGLALWLTQQSPFPIAMAERHFSLAPLNPNQRQNLGQALQRVEGLVIKPGEIFSFNRIVGPRTPNRGYLAAASYLDGDTPATVGGGICLLSSALYQLALEIGLPVTERVPHLRTVKSVLPGLDASVWYGQADLKFKNTNPFPIQLHAHQDRSELSVSVNGQAPPLIRPHIKRIVGYHAHRQVQVAVYADQKRLSLDLYDLPH